MQHDLNEARLTREPQWIKQWVGATHVWCVSFAMFLKQYK